MPNPIRSVTKLDLCPDGLPFHRRWTGGTCSFAGDLKKGGPHDKDQKSQERWLENGRVILECQGDDFLSGAFRGIIGIPRMQVHLLQTTDVTYNVYGAGVARLWNQLKRDI